MRDIYLDYNATTPVDEAVLEAMLPFLREQFGNPSSEHPLGHAAKNAVRIAREHVAALIGARPEEIIFTGGGTEASNLAIRGTLPDNRPAIVTSAFEHPATEACCALLERHGHRVTRIKPAPDGIVSAQAMADAIDANTGLVTLIHSQNEIGTLQPVAEVAEAAHREGALIHGDAAQSLGKVPVDVNALDVDLLSIAGHKLYAPKGIGALYVSNGTTLRPVLVGAGQEHGIRPGTENVAYIVGLGEACRLARENLQSFQMRARKLSTRLIQNLRNELPGIVLVGDPDKRLPNTLNVLFPGVSGRQLLFACNRTMASNGSACHANNEDPSAVLLALGIGREEALGTVRLSLGRATTAQQVDEAAADLAAAWRTLTQGHDARNRALGGVSS